MTDDSYVDTGALALRSLIVQPQSLSYMDSLFPPAAWPLVLTWWAWVGMACAQEGLDCTLCWKTKI